MDTEKKEHEKNKKKSAQDYFDNHYDPPSDPKLKAEYDKVHDETRGKWQDENTYHLP